MSVLNKEVDRALIEAWREFRKYDSAAVASKYDSHGARKIVVVIMAAASICAVLASVIRGPGGINAVRTIFAIAAFVLPIIAFYIFADIQHRGRISNWIKFRYIAEEIRMHIYLYRTQAGDYRTDEEQPAHELNNKLMANIGALRERWKGVSTSAEVDRVTDEEILKFLADLHTIGATTNRTFFRRTPPDVAEKPAEGRDDGLSIIDANHYLKWRVQDQIRWYEGRIHNDIDANQWYFRASQTFLLIGAVAAGLSGLNQFQWVWLVVVTNALSAAVIAWANVGNAGNTFPIYEIARRKLEELDDAWIGYQNDPLFTDPDRTQERRVLIWEFIEKVESLLQWERDEWYEQTLQAQQQSDNALADDLTRMQKRADDAAEQTFTDGEDPLPDPGDAAGSMTP